MTATAWIEYMKFKSGTTLSLSKNSIVVFVGPNNSGKSLALREIMQLTGGPQNNRLVIDEIKMKLEGSAADFLNTVESNRIGDIYYYPEQSGGGVNSDNLSRNWDNLAQGNSQSLFPVSRFLATTLTTQNRLNLVTPAANIDFTTQPKNNPIHTLKEDTEKERLFSRFFKQAFGEDIIVNHGAGTVIPLHVGSRPESTKENDRVSTVYQKALRSLPMLQEQGDGMKSFAGVFLTLFTEPFSVNIIDEPEAFLHPPQATLLAQMMAQKLGDDKQIFVATHSEHFLKGLLEARSDRLIVVRIQRTQTGNTINVLENEELKQIWKDPLLRYSNVLDGLFHKKVVLVESDADCRFYNAIATAMVEKEGLVSPDILFVQSGGKHRFPVVLRALKKLDVPVITIGDFDFYHHEDPTKFIYEELGGKWEDIRDDFMKVKKAIDEKRPELEVTDLKNAVDKIFQSFTGRIIPEEKINEIKLVLKKTSPWAQAKASGKAYLPAGEAIQAFSRVQAALKEKNIIVLEVGEIEAFCKSVGGHGPKWVNHVMEKDLINDDDLQVARQFVRANIL